MQGRLDEAVAAYRAFLDTRPSLSEEGPARTNLSVCLAMLQRFDEAHAQMLQALAVVRRLGDRRFEGILEFNLGALQQDIGDPRARETLEAALALNTELGNLRFVGLCHANLGKMERDAGQLELARAHLQQAVALASGASPREEGRALLALAEIEAEAGRPSEARLALEAAEQRMKTADREAMAAQITSVRAKLPR